MGFKDMMLKLGLDSSELEKGIESSQKKLGTLGGEVGKFVGQFAGPMGAIAAVGLAGKALFDLGTAYDKASADMAKSTGKTGDSLQQLNNDLRAVQATGIEQSLEDTSRAMASLSKSFDLAGASLQDATLLFSAFADTTGTSMTQAVKETNEAMKQWGMTTEDIPGYLDAITVATQKTNTTASEFSALMQRAAPIFQQYGYNAKDTLAILTSFETIGMNSEKAILAMQTALAKFGKENKNAGPALQEVFDKIKELGPTAASTALAVETFGSRTGVQLANAIQTGKLSIEQMTKSLGDVEGALKKTDAAAGETQDTFAKGFGQLGQAFAPVGKGITDTLGSMAQSLGDFAMNTDKSFNALVGRLTGDIGKELRNITDETSQDYKSMSEGAKSYLAELDKWAGGQDRAALSAERLTARSKIEINVIDQHISALDARTKHLEKSAEVAIAAYERMAGIKHTPPPVSNGPTKEEIDAWNAAYKAQNEYMHKLRMDDEADAKKVLKMKYDDEVKLVNETIAYGKDGAKEKAAALLILEAKYNTDLFKLKQDEEKKERALRDKYAEYAQQANEEDIEGNKTMLDKMGEAWTQYYEDLKAKSEDWGAVVTSISDTVTGALSNGLVSLGEALYKGEDGWKSLANMALTALADILEAIGKQLAAMAAVALLSGNIPGVLIAGAAATAALIGAGVVRGMASGYEYGTTNAEAGMHEMAEAGPELVLKRGTYPLKGGETVLNAGDTAKALGGGKTIEVHLHSPKEQSLREAGQVFTRVARGLRLENVL